MIKFFISKQFFAIICWELCGKKCPTVQAENCTNWSREGRVCLQNWHAGRNHSAVFHVSKWLTYIHAVVSQNCVRTRLLYQVTTKIVISGRADVLYESLRGVDSKRCGNTVTREDEITASRRVSDTAGRQPMPQSGGGEHWTRDHDEMGSQCRTMTSNYTRSRAG